MPVGTSESRPSTPRPRVGVTAVWLRVTGSRTRAIRLTRKWAPPGRGSLGKARRTACQWRQPARPGSDSGCQRATVIVTVRNDSSETDESDSEFGPGAMPVTDNVTLEAQWGSGPGEQGRTARSVALGATEKQPEPPRQIA